MPMPRKVAPLKVCLGCGTMLSRKMFESRIEDMGVFRRRKYCSQPCMGMARRKTEVKRTTYLWRARKLRGPNCEACGTTTRLQAHHCDGIQSNNTAENIQTLCIHCHRFWHFSLQNTGRQVTGRMPSLWRTP